VGRPDLPSAQTPLAAPCLRKFPDYVNLSPAMRAGLMLALMTPHGPEPKHTPVAAGDQSPPAGLTAFARAERALRHLGRLLRRADIRRGVYAYERARDLPCLIEVAPRFLHDPRADVSRLIQRQLRAALRLSVSRKGSKAWSAQHHRALLTALGGEMRHTGSRLLSPDALKARIAGYCSTVSSSSSSSSASGSSPGATSTAQRPDQRPVPANSSG